MIKISVVIATYNRGDKIPFLLDDLNSQTLSKDAFEVIIVNDGSMDNTIKILQAKKLELSSLRLILIHQNNAGQAAARQNGSQVAQGQVLLFLDDDMRIKDQDFLKLHLEKHLKNTKLVVLGRIIPPEDRKKRQAFEYFYERLLERMYTRFESGSLRPGGAHFFSGNVSLSKELFFEAGGFNQAYLHGEDRELGLRLELISKAEFCFAPRAISYHHSGTSSFSSFTKRSFLYGLYNTKMASQFSQKRELDPVLEITKLGPFKRLLTRTVLLSDILSRVLGGIFIFIANFLLLLNKTKESSLACAPVYHLYYVMGIKEAVGGKKPLRERLNEHKKDQ